MGWIAYLRRALGPDNSGKTAIIEQSRMISLDGRQSILPRQCQTNGVTEISFTLSSTDWRMVDQGDQCIERKKWMHCFEDVDFLMFVVALSSYDQYLAEDHSVVRVTLNAVFDNDF